MPYESMPLYVRDVLENEGALNPPAVTGKSILLAPSGPLISRGKAERRPLTLRDGQRRPRSILQALNELTLCR